MAVSLWGWGAASGGVFSFLSMIHCGADDLAIYSASRAAIFLLSYASPPTTGSLIDQER